MKLIILISGVFTLQICSIKKPLTSKKKLFEPREILQEDKFINTNTTANINHLKTDEYIPLKRLNNDTLLNNIQHKITVASNDGFTSKNIEKLNNLESLLTENSIKNENLRYYWIAYINYYKTIIAMQSKNKDIAEKANKKGIEVLKKIKNKNADDYALYILIKGLSFSFISGMEAPFISKEISTLIKKGLTSDNTNFRLYYAQGSTDFYTPKEYGGGKKTEGFLLKAINLSEKNTANSQLPTWGKEETYALIIRFYIREKNKEKAKTYFEKAKQLFPNSHIIKMYQSNFT